MSTLIYINVAILLVSTAILFLLVFISKKINLITESPSTTIRKIHKKRMIKIGGTSFLSLLTLLCFIKNYDLLLILIFSVVFIIIGIFSDLNEKFSSRLRLFLFTFFLTIYLLIGNNYINNLELEFLNQIILNNFFSIFVFSILSYLLLINGTNIIDGLHGLKTGSIMIIAFFILYQVPSNEMELIILISSIIFACTPLFIINYLFGNIRSGDSGSYFLGFIIGSIVIYINRLDFINAFHIGCMLAYPIIEVVFSYFRRLLGKKNPFQADNLHLHTLLFYFFKTKKFIIAVNEENSNRLASSIILFYQILFNASVIFFAEETLDYSMFLILIFLNYLLAYIALHHYKSSYE